MLTAIFFLPSCHPQTIRKPFSQDNMSNATLCDSLTSTVIAKKRSQAVTKVRTLRIVIEKSHEPPKPQEKVTSPPITTKIARRRLARANTMRTTQTSELLTISFVNILTRTEKTSILHCRRRSGLWLIQTLLTPPQVRQQ